MKGRCLRIKIGAYIDPAEPRAVKFPKAIISIEFNPREIVFHFLLPDGSIDEVTYSITPRRGHQLEAMRIESAVSNDVFPIVNADTIEKIFPISNAADLEDGGIFEDEDGDIMYNKKKKKKDKKSPFSTRLRI